MFKRVIFICLLFLMSFTGCTNTVDNTQDLNWNVDNDEVLVYNHFLQKFVKYNTLQKTGVPIQPQTRTGIMQYAFNTPSVYFTSGDSSDNNFSILEYKNGLVKEVYELEDKKNLGIFPLATDGVNYFFIKTNYAMESEIESVVVKYENNRLYEYVNTKGLISYGGLIDNMLYYTSYNSSTDDYTLYALDTLDYNAKPTVIKDNLISGEIIILNEKVYCTDKESIYSDEDKFNKRSINLSDPKHNLLIQLDPSEDASFLVLTITDSKSKEIILSTDNVIGIDLNESILTVYTQGSVETINLQQLMTS